MLFPFLGRCAYRREVEQEDPPRSALFVLAPVFLFLWLHVLRHSRAPASPRRCVLRLPNSPKKRRQTAAPTNRDREIVCIISWVRGDRTDCCATTQPSVLEQACMYLVYNMSSLLRRIPLSRRPRAVECFAMSIICHVCTHT